MPATPPLLPATIDCDAACVAQARLFNRLLACLPRFTIRKPWTPRLLHAMLLLSQTGADARLSRAGLRTTQGAAPGKPPIPVRIIQPTGKPRALVIDIHGGGWAIGNPQLNDKLNAALVHACGVAVVSIDYRLAPSVPLETILADCVGAARWLLRDGLPEFAGLPVILIGESAGAHLAAASLLALQSDPASLKRIIGAVLYYGLYDLGGTPSVRRAGREVLLFDGPDLVPALARLTPHLDDAARRQPPLSPLYGDLSGLPAALMIAGQSYPLLDDTLLLADKWRHTSPVELHVLPEAPHGFIRFPTTMARLTQARAHAWINARIAMETDTAKCMSPC